MTWIFWIAAACVLYGYIGFPILLWIRARLFPRDFQSDPIQPSVSVLIAAYNEADHIAQRIENLIDQDYPSDKLQIIVASDGSSDTTNDIVREFRDPRIVLLALPRQGKGQALNAAAEAATGDILVMTDANTHYATDSVQQLVAPFADPTVGGVAGNQCYLRGEQTSSTADGERMYWNYDQWLKSQQSIAGSVTSATGAIYAIRREMFEPVPADAMDDFYVSTGVIRKGTRLVYAPGAKAYEPVAEAKGVEYSRKLRVITQGLQAVFYRRELLNPLRFGFYAWQLFSHKVLRRLVGIPMLIMALVCPFLWNSGLIYQVLLVGEVGILSLLVAACLLRSTRLGRSKPMAVAWYFLMVNVAAMVAAISVLRGHRIRRWEPERHQQSSDVSHDSVESAMS